MKIIIKNTNLNGQNIQLDTVKENMSKHKYRSVQLIQNTAQRNKEWENTKGNLRDLEDRIESLTCIQLESHRQRERKTKQNRGHRKQAIFEMRTLEKLPDLMKDMNPQKEKSWLIK